MTLISRICDIFLDMTEVAPEEVLMALAAMIRDEGLGSDTRRVTVACSPTLRIRLRDAHPELHVQDHHGKALADALAGAGARGRGLALIQGNWDWRSQTVDLLAGQFGSDPMIATVQPRYLDAAAEQVFGLPFDGHLRLPHAAAAYLPEYYVTAEFLSPMIIVGPQAVAAAPRPDAAEMATAFAQLLSGLRRRGYRNLVCNRIFAPWSGTGAPCDRALAPLENEDPALLAAISSEQPELKLERLLAGAFDAAGRPRILLDVRGMPAFVNGTTVCALGFLSGFHALIEMGITITVLATSKASATHRLAERFPGFEIQHDEPKGSFMAIVLLNQPWAVAWLREMHGCAALISANMLDTILWDIMFVSNPGLRRAWSLLGQCADLLFFNTAYSRDRYAFRFRPRADLPSVVTHHSMVAGEITHPSAGPRAIPERYVLVMGNSYDHKDLRRTLALLSDAFPFLQLACIGDEVKDMAHVISYPSGEISDEVIADLYRHCEAVVFPSHYEGFGLPVAEAIAYGKRVIVRDFPLWDELQSITAHPEAIHRFRCESDLVRALGEIVSAVQSPLHKASEAECAVEPSWEICAGRIVRAVEKAIADFDGHHWMMRDDVLAVE